MNRRSDPRCSLRGPGKGIGGKGASGDDLSSEMGAEEVKARECVRESGLG